MFDLVVRLPITSDVTEEQALRHTRQKYSKQAFFWFQQSQNFELTQNNKKTKQLTTNNNNSIDKQILDCFSLVHNTH